MERYEKYKDSGIEWIGEIPEHWEVMSFRYVINILTDYTANGSFASLAENVTYLLSGYSRVVRLTDLRVNFENDGIYVDEFAHNFLKKSELFGGELLIANVGAYAGLVVLMPLVDGKYTLGPNMFLVKTNQNNEFIFYLLNSTFCNEQLKMMSISSAQPKLNKDNIRDLKVILPSIKEQECICNYLKSKTSQIDRIIANKQRLIAHYEEEKQSIINQAVTKGLDPNVPMKPSGVEWLGDIPEHWEVKRIGYCSSVVRGASPRPSGDPRYFCGNYMPWITVKEVTNAIGRYIVSTDEYLTEDGSKLSRIIFPETLLLSNSGATLGVPKISKIKGCINDGSVAFTSFKDCLLRDYLFLFLESHTQIYREEMKGNGQPNLNTEIIKSTPIAVPSIKEQEHIISYVENKFKQLDTIVLKYKKQIDLFQEYRTTLINEVVTGKVKVPK